MRQSGKRITPVLWLVLLLCAFELAVRLPYLIWAKSNAYIGYATRFVFFSVYNPDSVILDGTLITIMVLIVAFIAQRLVVADFTSRPQPVRLLNLGWAAYGMAFFTLVSVFFCLQQLGFQAIQENISAKRDLDSIEAGFLLYLFLKISLFNHVVATLFYMQYLGTRRLLHLGLFLFFAATTALVSVIFSQRAMLFVLAFEIIYVTYLYGELNVRKLLSFVVPFGLILVSIGILRSAASDGLPLGEAILFGLDKVMTSRYFFHLSKMGCVYEWQTFNGLIDFLSFNFVLEPFNPEKIIFFKDVGPLIGREIFGHTNSGVTLGFVSEYILSFGAALGSFFIFITFMLIFRLERFVLSRKHLPVLVFFALAKMPILFNTSLGSYLYQVVIETAMLLPIVAGLTWAGGKVRRKPDARLRFA